MHLYEKPFIVPTIYGFNMIINPKMSRQERDIYLYGSYEPGTINVIKHILKKGDTFIDIGGSIGIMSLAASKFIGKNGLVYAFEPDPYNFAILKRNIAINNFNNVFPFNFGLGSKKEKRVMFCLLNHRGGSLIERNNRFLKKEVEILSLDQFVIEKNIKKIKMIKIDVEGWELEVLRGCEKILKKSNAPIICIEYSKTVPLKDGEKVSRIYQFITFINNKYKIFKFEKSKSYKSKLIRVKNTTQLPKHDNIFFFLPNHLNNLRNKRSLFK